MRYLCVDGMLSGTGVRDAVDGGYINPDELGLSLELKAVIADWLSRYAEAHYAQFGDKDEVAEIDALGVAICRKVREELPQSKIDYFSSALMRRLDCE